MSNNDVATKAAKALLNDSLKVIEYRYEMLTTVERGLVTDTEFAELVKWLKEES